MTPEEHKQVNDLLLDTARQRDDAEGRATIWKCIALFLLAMMILSFIAEHFGWFPDPRF